MDDTEPHNDTVCVFSFGTMVVEEGLLERMPSSLLLYQNRPNPFSRLTVVSYEILSSENVDLSVYDVTGSLMKNLISGTKHGGFHTVAWDRTENTGVSVDDGVHFVKPLAGENRLLTKAVLMR